MAVGAIRIAGIPSWRKYRRDQVREQLDVLTRARIADANMRSRRRSALPRNWRDRIIREIPRKKRSMTQSVPSFARNLALDYHDGRESATVINILTRNGEKVAQGDILFVLKPWR